MFRIFTKAGKLYVVIFSLLLGILTACGSGGGNTSATTVFEGNVVDSKGAPVSNIQAYIFETYENSSTDDQGSFAIESSSRFNSVRFFFQTSAYTNTVVIDGIPDDAVTIRATFGFDKATNTVAVTHVEFDNSPASPMPAPTSSPGETTGATPTVTPSPTASGKPGQSGTPTPHSSPTPKPTQKGNFDSNGNTTAFGIPSGTTGNVKSGSSTWGAKCASCHAAEKTGRLYGQIKGSFKVVPSMMSLSVSNQEIANLTAYLNRGR